MKSEDQTDSLIGFIVVMSVAATAIGLGTVFFGTQAVFAPFMWLSVAFAGAVSFFFKTAIASAINWFLAVFVLGGAAYFLKSYLKNKPDSQP